LTRLLIDANLLVLLVVGSANTRYIAGHKNLGAYEVDDYHRLVALLGHVQELVFVPNVLTETFNLVRQVGEPLKSELTAHFGVMLKQVGEEYVPSAEVVDDDGFDRLGLTDSVILKVMQTGAILLTADIALYLAAATAGLPVCNYNHIRDRDPGFNPWAS